jgi:hypothetical protein
MAGGNQDRSEETVRRPADLGPSFPDSLVQKGPKAEIPAELPWESLCCCPGIYNGVYATGIDSSSLAVS